MSSTNLPSNIVSDSPSTEHLTWHQAITTTEQLLWQGKYLSVRQVTLQLGAEGDDDAQEVPPPFQTEVVDICCESVAVLPYNLTAEGELYELGVRHELIAAWDATRPTLCTLTGTVDPPDHTPLHTACRELLEESGYALDVTDTRWTYLGKLTTHKALHHAYECFAVNLDGLKPGTLPPGVEPGEFRWLRVNAALHTVQDALFGAMFLRLWQAHLDQR